MMQLYDMHCHVDFAPAAEKTAAAAAADGCGMLCTTVTPAGFDRARVRLGAYGNVRVGVGLHPWWLSDGRCGADDVEALVNAVAAAPFVGEVGLDFSARCVAAKEAQVQAFRHMARALALTGGKVLSIHAVKSAGVALDILEEAGALSRNVCIFHWFSGNSNELHRARLAGCYFSVNHIMLGTRRGREYARQLPVGRLLLESDHPASEGDALPWAVQRACLLQALRMAAQARGADEEELAGRIAQTSRGILAMGPAACADRFRESVRICDAQGNENAAKCRE